MSADTTRPVLVTGAAGFVAFHTIERLLREGRSVVGIDNFDPFYGREHKERNLADLERVAKETGKRFQFVEGDVCAIDGKFCPGEAFGSVIHLAAKAGVRPSLRAPEEYLRANVQGTLRVLELCRERGVHHLVSVSSSSVYGDSTPAPFREDAPAMHPVSPYAASKRSAELYCGTWAHLHRMRIAVLRYFTVYGPRQRPDLAIHKFTALMLAQKPITLFGDGTTERDYTFVADIVDGTLRAEKWIAAAEPGTCEAFNLGGGSTTSLDTLVRLLEVALGKKATIERTHVQPGDVQRTSADVSKAARLLGWKPGTSMPEGLAQFAAWYRATHAGP